MPSSPYSTVFHKRSSTPGATPSALSLSAGEVAINTNDGILFTKTVDESIKTFLNSEQMPYKLDTSLSATVPQYGSNVVSQVLSVVLGGYLNNVAGAASIIANGESNSLLGDFGFIGSGGYNVIEPAGDFSAIVGGHHNLISHANSFVLGSNLSSHAENFTYVNNISGIYYGDGSNLTGITSPVGIYVPLSGGIIQGDLTVTGSFSTVNTDNWQSVYTTVYDTSAQWNSGGNNNTVNNPLSSYQFFGDGYTVIFELSSRIPYTNAAGYVVSLNGATQVPFKDYTVYYASGTNKLSTDFIPPLGCEISVVYLGNRLDSITIVEGGGGGGSDVSLLSSYWQDTYTTVSANSALWNVVGSDVGLLSSNWQNTYTNVLANSASWNLVGSDVKLLSGNWQDTYTTVLTNSASWNVVGSDVGLLSSNWQDTYTSVLANSALWNTYISKLPLSGGTIHGNLLVTGSLSVLSGATFINTVFNNTSALEIRNTGLGPALYVSQGAGAGDIASFYDGDGIEVLHVGNALNPISEGVIGIKTSNPNKTLTVVGEICATGEVWASKYYGDGSSLTSVIGTDSSKLPLSGGTLTGNLTGTSATFTSVSAAKFLGDGGSLTGLNVDTTKLVPLSGGTMTGTLKVVAGTSTTVPLLLQSGTITSSPTAHAVEWDGSQLYVTTSSFNRRKISYADETVTIFSANPANFATNTFYADTQEIHYYTLSATNNFVVDVVGNNTTSYNNLVGVNSCRTICILNTSGLSAYAPTLRIDGTNQTVKWQGNQSTGNPEALDAWTFTIIKTGINAYTTLGSITLYS